MLCKIVVSFDFLKVMKKVSLVDLEVPSDHSGFSHLYWRKTKDTFVTKLYFHFNNISVPENWPLSCWTCIFCQKNPTEIENLFYKGGLANTGSNAQRFVKTDIDNNNS